MTIQADADRLVRGLVELVGTNSVNPTLVPGAPGEVEIAEVTARQMSESGLSVERYEPETGRPSIVGRLQGTEPRVPSRESRGHCPRSHARPSCTNARRSFPNRSL